MNLAKQTNNKNNLNYFIDFLLMQEDLQDKLKNNPDETPEKMWDYIFARIKEEVEVSSYCDDGTLVLKYTKEYLDDYNVIKANQKPTFINPLESKSLKEEEKPAKQEKTAKIETLKVEPKENKGVEEKTPKKAIKEEITKPKQMSIFDF